MSFWDYILPLLLLFFLYQNERTWSAIKDLFDKVMHWVQTGNWK